MEKEASRAEIVINFDQLVQVVVVGVRRASAFMVIGTRAAKELDLSSVALPTFFSHRFFPDPLPPEMSAEVRNEFGTWIVGAALREAEQHISYFLDRIKECLTLATVHGTQINAPPEIRNKSFETKSTADKFAEIALVLGPLNDHEKHLRRLTKTRNVFAHWLGRVTADYAKEDGHLVVSWLGFETALVGEGQRFVLPHESTEPVQSPGFETMLTLTVVERERKFGVGQKIELTPIELNEICQYYWIVGMQIADAARKHFADKGMLNVTGRADQSKSAES